MSLTRASFVPRLPGSKSLTHRALLLGAQRMGRTEVANGQHGDDTEALARALGAFEGLHVDTTPNGFVVEREARPLRAPDSPLDLGGAGAPARMMLAFAVSASGTTVITGSKRLCERPMGPILRSFDQMGVEYQCLTRPDCLPIAVRGGPVRTHHWHVDGSVSSQFTTALLLLASSQTTPIRLSIHGEITSRPYLEMTKGMMTAAGIVVRAESNGELIVSPGEPWTSRIDIEPDASAASYFLGAAALCRREVSLPGIGSSLQGDFGFIGVLERMGCLVKLGPSITLEGPSELRGVDEDLRDMPDVALTLAALAAAAKGTTKIRSIGNLRLKECDRVSAAAEALRALGATVEESADALTIEGRSPNDLRPCLVETRGDHRMSMAFGLLSLLQAGVEVDDRACVSKSFPEFWAELDRFERALE